MGVLAQEKTLAGRIVVKDATPGGVRILNLVNEKEAVSDAQGNFSIFAKPDDLLLFSAGHLDLMRHVVEEDEFRQGTLTVVMTARIRQLDEVEIRQVHIDPVALRILEKPAKTYTPAERRLRTARHVFVGPVKGGGTGITLDPVINYLSGRSKRLKKELDVEGRERALRRMQDRFGPSYYLEQYGIEASESASFEYFCIEDDDFRMALQEKDDALTQRLFFLAAAYLKLQEDPAVTNPEKD